MIKHIALIAAALCKPSREKLMYNHAEWLFQFFPKKISKLYPRLLRTYASEHIGPKATDKINRNLMLITDLLGESIAVELKNYLLEKYKHTSLLKL